MRGLLLLAFVALLLLLLLAFVALVALTPNHGLRCLELPTTLKHDEDTRIEK